MPRARALGGSALLLATLASCGAEEVLLEPFRGETPRERYEEVLGRAGLEGSAMVRSWHLAARRSLLDAVQVAPPLVEEAWLPAEEPMALGYAVDARRGQRIHVRVRTDDPVAQLFLEIFRVEDPREEESELLVAHAEPWEREITYDARATGRYVVRVQPELMAGGAVEVSIDLGPSLAFPVEGHSTRNVLSFFGDVRDGGARDHHGVDIFAPRGTPVRAVAAGEVYRVGLTSLGGKVVWVRDPSGDQRAYYAHLDSQVVKNGDLVRVGDVLGFVGNTGNARTTPPHLHFGVYVRRGGAVDPFPFLHDPGGEPAALAVSREAFRQTLRVRATGSALRAAPVRSAPLVAELAESLPVDVLGGSGAWYRVRTADGRHGYAMAETLESADVPLGRETLSGGAVLRMAPDDGARRVLGVTGAREVAVLGRAGSWLWVADVRETGDAAATAPPAARGWVSVAVE